MTVSDPYRQRLVGTITEEVERARRQAASIAAARRRFAQAHLPPAPWPAPKESDRRYNVSAAQRAVARRARKDRTCEP